MIKKISTSDISIISSCIRQCNLLTESPTVDYVESNRSPCDGDIVLARVLAADGAYASTEIISGENIPLIKGMLGLFVLATRKSGKSVSAYIPGEQLCAGLNLDVIAQGGLISKASCVPAHLSGRVSSVDIVGFLTNKANEILNISQAPLIRIADQVFNREPVRDVPIIFVAGTSAESGKTTLMSSLCLALKSDFDRIFAVKICGTGRLKDKLSYLSAGFSGAVDFVDAGIPTTYNVSDSKYFEIISSLINYAKNNGDVVCVEIGGDFFEGMAPQALDFMSQNGKLCFVVVNDAMGASSALHMLGKINVTPIGICSFGQNLKMLAHRIGVEQERVIDNKDSASILLLLKKSGVTKGAFDE